MLDTLPFLPFLLFAIVASITPGPTNVIVLSHSARRGIVATLPIIIGGCGGAALLVLAVGIGIGDADQLVEMELLSVRRERAQ